MRYEGQVYRPPSEADAYILQATIGCSWNKCTYCAMYRDKQFRIRPEVECLQDIDRAAQLAGDRITKLFVADGDALAMPVERWQPLLETAAVRLPVLRRTSCYATARNLLEKSADELQTLRRLGLTRLYIGPESGDDETLRRIAKGATAAEHAAAAEAAKAAGMELSVIFLLGAGGVARTEQHARASAELATAMNPEFLACLTLTIDPSTPIARAAAKGLFEMPDAATIDAELRTFVAHARPENSLFRSNHASNETVLTGRLPQDRDRMLAALDCGSARRGQFPR